MVFHEVDEVGNCAAFLKLLAVARVLKHAFFEPSLHFVAIKVSWRRQTFELGGGQSVVGTRILVRFEVVDQLVNDARPLFSLRGSLRSILLAFLAPVLLELPLAFVLGRHRLDYERLDGRELGVAAALDLVAQL